GQLLDGKASVTCSGQRIITPLGQLQERENTLNNIGIHLACNGDVTIFTIKE
ncbi:sodium-coupled monocarboxylate transporter 2-like X5, partial [Biomphalaria glabrata]